MARPKTDSTVLTIRVPVSLDRRLAREARRRRLTRSEVARAILDGPYTSKPRPAVVVQADLFTPTHASVTVCPITSDCVDAPLFRVTLASSDRTGLTTSSQVMVDKIVSGPRGAIVREVGRCNPDEIAAIDDALRFWLAL
jgi:mRNA interferase MazF